MKRLTVVFSFLLLVLQYSAQAGGKVFCIGYDSGDRKYNIVVGTTQREIDLFVKQEQISFVGLSTNVISANTINRILQYENRHCNKVNTRKQGDLNLYWITVFRDGKSERCYLVGKPAAREYYEGLKKWLKNEPYRKNSQAVLTKFSKLL